VGGKNKEIMIFSELLDKAFIKHFKISNLEREVKSYFFIAHYKVFC
jgi:hypothetical protein